MTAARTDSQSPDSSRVSKECTVINRLGIHARPAALFVKVANKFDSDITVEKDGEAVNGKSIMGLMMLAAGYNSKLRITADCHDAARAVLEIEQLFAQKFNED